MKKYNTRSAWSKIRAINLKFGFSIALLFVLFAFQWEVKEQPAKEYTLILDEGILDMTNEVPRIKLKKVVPPPTPEIKSIINKEVILTDLVIEQIDDELEDDLVDDLIDEDVFEGIDFGQDEGDQNFKVEIASTKAEDEIFILVQEMPIFGSCDSEDKKERKLCSDKAILEYVYDHLKYPTLAKELGIEGSAVATFVVTKEGKVEQIEIARELGGGCSQELLRVLNNMPDWIPGINNFKAVNVKMTIPVKFRLQ